MTHANRVDSLGLLNVSVTSASRADFFRSRGPFIPNMRASSPCTRTIVTHQVDFSGRTTHTHTDLINGQLSKRASGPFAKCALTFCPVFRASVYRSANLFPLARTFVFPPRKWGGGKGYSGPLPKKWGSHGPRLPPSTQCRRSC